MMSLIQMIVMIQVDDFGSYAYFWKEKNRKRKEAREKRREKKGVKKRKLQQEQKSVNVIRSIVKITSDKRSITMVVSPLKMKMTSLEDFFSKEKEVEELVRRLKDAPKIYRKYLNYLQNRREEDENKERYMNQKEELQNLEKKMENEMKKRRDAHAHQITFDENTEVYLIGNDCNCNFWNSRAIVFKNATFK